MATQLLTSYSESNRDDRYILYSGSIIRAGQSFLGNGRKIASVQFQLSKTGSPTGNATVSVYAHSGTFGTSSVGTGSALATSSTLDVSTLDGTYTLTEFTFSGDNAILLEAGTPYVVVLEYSGGDISNNVNLGVDTSSPTHEGNATNYVASWSAAATIDSCFYVYVNSFAGYSPMTFKARPIKLKPLKFKRGR